MLPDDLAADRKPQPGSTGAFCRSEQAEKTWQLVFGNPRSVVVDIHKHRRDRRIAPHLHNDHSARASFNRVNGVGDHIEYRSVNPFWIVVRFTRPFWKDSFQDHTGLVSP